MDVTLMEQSSLDQFKSRLGQVREDAPRKWGELDARRMFVHLRYAVRLSLQEVAFEGDPPKRVGPFMRWMVFHVLPWPKGKIKAPPSFTPEADSDFETERSACLEALDRFADAAEREPDRVTEHPVFGKLPLSYWKRIHGKHLEHHLQQFGV